MQTRLNDFKHINWIWDLALHGRSQFIQFLLRAVLTRPDTILIESMTLDAMAYCEDRARCGQEKCAQKRLPSSGIQIRRELIEDLAQIKLVVREHTSLGVWLAGRSNRSTHCTSPAKITAAEMDMIQIWIPVRGSDTSV